MTRSRSFRRQMRNKHISRKTQIIKNIRHDTEVLGDERFVGKLDKGKVHCSCPLCREKTKEIGFKVSDLRKLGDDEIVYE